MALRNIVSLLILSALAPAATGAEIDDRLDWSAWQHLPTFHDGRIMPVNTFARIAAEKICGRANPKLSLSGAGDGFGPSDSEDARKLFGGLDKRRWTAPELLFSWLVEPQRWEDVPFLLAGHEELRQDVFGLPISDEEGNRLKHVSPRQVADSHGLQMRRDEFAKERFKAQAAGEKHKPSQLEEKLDELYEAFVLYRLITFNPPADDTNRIRFHGKLTEASKTWRALEPTLTHFSNTDDTAGIGQLVSIAKESIATLDELRVGGDIPLAEAEPAAVTLKESTAALADEFAQHKDRIFDDVQPDLPENQLKRLRSQMHALAASTAKLARLANEAHLALYDNGYSLRLVPGLNPAALDNGRDPDDDAQPWVNLQTLLTGSNEVLDGFPSGRIDDVRSTFAEAADVYLDRGRSDRAGEFATAMNSFAGAIRQLAEEVETARQKLPIHQRDEELIALTAYPPPGATDMEVHYYQLDPFLWSWVISALSMVCFGLAFGVVRKPMFWLGIVVLVAAQAFTVYGLGLRVYVTGWAPVTNMFETVIFVALTVALLGLWLVMYPIFGPGLRTAWQLTAVPMTFEAKTSSADETSESDTNRLNAARWLLLIPRLILAAALFWLMTMVPFGIGGGYTAISLVPRTDVGSSIPTLNDLTVWAVGLCLLGLIVWYIPRSVTALCAAVFTTSHNLRKHGLAEPLAEAIARKPYALVGASVAFFAALLTYYAPISGKHIGLLMPVLRDNFWLTLHVLSITASYGAGALAWGLGNIALGYYLLGKYRDPTDTLEVAAKRPPEVCSSLGTFIYKATQVTVLLLAAGTITGALWADVAWGRFWGWDSKEVWALISLMVYLAVLHGRSAGWFGNFGLAVGSVIGAISILMAWYGVNFVLGSGLHAYGEGSGGLTWALNAVSMNLAFAVAASIRYLMETRPALPPVETGAAE